jgi:CDGSH-type Zn-finger protein/uncharacterized Fe-S cluster protein YjdI
MNLPTEEFEEESMGDVSEYRGSGLVVTYNVKRCIHAAECVKGLPEVFDPKAKPWVQPDKASTQRVIAVVLQCPSGALSTVREDGSAAEFAPAANEARLTADGPLYLRGNIEVYSGDGQLVARETRMALCRCGASQNKPYCDNSHVGAGFRHDGTCARPEVSEVGAGGPLKVTLLTDGPALIDGPLTVLDAFGETIYHGAQCWLCRCGGSGNKPFCDGTHKKIGFVG